MIARFALRAAALGLAAAGVLAPAPAAAYVRYRTTQGNPFSWRTTSVPITAYPQGLPNLTLDQITNAITSSVNAWTAVDPNIAPCSYLQLPVTMASLTTPEPDAKYDQQNPHNIIVFRDTNWEQICSLDANKEPTICHSSVQLAITTIFSRACGEIVTADVEVNAWDYTWGDLDVMPGDGSLQDLQNALTHEMGHFIGLDHTCYISPGDYPNGLPVDSDGAPLNACDKATPDQHQSTMFPSADPGDTSKRTLTANDQQAVCDIYPIGTSPQMCGEGNSSSGCTVAATAGDLRAPGAARAPLGRGWLAAGLGAAAAALVGGRRARRRRRP
jgi:hypothetical protein